MNQPYPRPSLTKLRPWLHAPLLAAVVALAVSSLAHASGTAPAKLAYLPELPGLHPNLARGYGLDRSFDADGASRVNRFNGNLVLSLPLGLRYPLSSHFAYQLMLSYNSTVWDYRPAAGGKAESEPLAWSNAGLGFDLSLGRLLAPGSPTNPTGQWIYVDFDGSPQLLYSTLHHDVAEPDDPNDDRLYTRDGTYLRLRRVSASERQLERPDGSVSVFQLQATEWRFVRQFRRGDEGLDLTVAYAPDGSQWTLSDAHGRVHVITFRDDPSGVYPRLVDTVDLEGFGGGRALYTFHYAATDVPRSCADHRAGTVAVPLLTSISEPEGQARDFSYFAAGADCVSGGRLQRAQLAAGGHRQWSYRVYSFPPIDCAGFTPPYFRSEAGVASRSLVRPDGTVEGTWTYDPVLTDAGMTCGEWRFHNAVTAPDGDRAVHHFSVANALSATGSPAEYALPLTRESTDASGTRFLSTEVHDCNGSGSGCTLVRSTFVAWTQDRQCADLTDGCGDTNRRPYAHRTEFHDDLDGAEVPRFVDVTRNGFDGLGHYRVETRTSNFGRADFYQTTTDYNPGAGSYPGAFTMPAGSAPWSLGTYAYERASDGIDSARRDACFDAEGRLLRQRWRNGDGQVPTAKDVVEVTTWDGWDRVEEADYGGDVQLLTTAANLCTIPLPAPQYRLRRAYQSGTLAAEHDLDATGKDLGFARLDRDADAHTGLVATRRDVAGIATHLEYDLLGRLTWEKPQAGHGAWVEHVYQPTTGGSNWWEGPKTIARRRPNGGGAPLASEVVWLDVFGRSAAVDETLPDGTTSRRRHQYDAAGRRNATSVRFAPTAGAQLGWFQSLDFDPFGRPRRLRPPEGADHDEVLTYTGVRETRRTVQAGRWYSPSGFCVEAAVTYADSYDGLGRLWKQREERPQPAPGFVRETEQRYDVAGRTVYLDKMETVGSTAGQVWTSQTWDARGFLLERQTYGSLAQVNRQVEHADLDARGNPRLTTRSGNGYPAGGLTVRTTYDAAGRPVSIADAADPTHLWKELDYGDANAPGDARRGKLVAARRFNYTVGGTYRVEDAYVYGGLGGRLSQSMLTIERTVGTPLLRRFRTELAYDELGQVETVDYPECLTCPAGGPDLDRVVTVDRSGDFVTAVHGTLDGIAESWLSGVSWGVDGRPAAVEHGNGVSELFAPDPYGHPRSSAIEVEGDFVQEETSPFIYDGEGRLCGSGMISNVPVRSETPSTPTSEIPCFDAARLDPFERLTDQIADPQCQGNEPAPVRLYDAADNLAGFIDTRARKQVLVGTELVWTSDPDRWRRTWNVHGPDGTVLRQVDEAYLDGSWRGTTDVVQQLGREIARQRHELTENGFTLVTTRHRHPIGRPTDQYGLPRATE